MFRMFHGKQKSNTLKLANFIIFVYTSVYKYAHCHTLIPKVIHNFINKKTGEHTCFY